MFGYNGVVISTLKCYMNDHFTDENFNEDVIDYINEDGIVIYPWNNDQGYEIFVFHEGD